MRFTRENRRSRFIVALARARRWRAVTRSRPGPGIDIFRSVKTNDARKAMTMESVDTCRGMVPSLKCPLHYREDAADRFRHAWPRKRDVGNVGFAAFVPFLGPFPLISALLGKKCARARHGVLMRFITMAYSRCFRFNFSLEFVGHDELVANTLLLHSRNSHCLVITVVRCLSMLL